MNLWYVCLWRYGYKGLEEKRRSNGLMFSLEDSLDLLYSPAMVAVFSPNFVHVNMAFWVVLTLCQVLYTLLSRDQKVHWSFFICSFEKYSGFPEGNNVGSLMFIVAFFSFLIIIAGGNVLD